MSKIALPEYHQAQTELTSASLSVTPAELQGLVAGMLSGGLILDGSSWKTILFDYTNEGMGWPHQAISLAENVYLKTLADFTQETLSLELLLPSEDDLLAYAEGVSEWVNHFISGLGLASAQLKKLSNDGKEALADLEEISRLGIDEDDDLQEQAILLEQVIEHAKVCVLTIHAELGQKLAKPSSSDSKTLH